MSENISAPGPIRPSLPHGPTQCTAVQKAFAEVLARALAERWAAFSPQLSSSPNSLAAPSIVTAPSQTVSNPTGIPRRDR